MGVFYIAKRSSASVERRNFQKMISCFPLNSFEGTNDFRVMPKGMISTAGIPFRIMDPEQNGGKGCLIVRGSERKRFPPAIRNIRIGGKFSRLFFLHTSAWGNSGACGGYRLHYQDGTSVDFPLNGGRNIGDWWQVKQLPEAEIGFTRKNASGAEIGFFVTEWKSNRKQI